MKKKTKALALCGICAAMGIGLATAAGGALGFGGTQIVAAKHDPSHILTEKAYTAPTTASEGYKPYWHCAECCKVSANEARYDYADKTTNVALGDIVMPKLTAATKDDVAEGDMISTINTKKFKFVDQGANGVDGKEGESTPLYVKDGDKTALFFSRSGKTGEGSQTGSEFRFSPENMSNITSATFSYRYLDYSTTTWTGGGTDGASEPSGAWRNLVQFYDEDGTSVKYYGKAVEFVNDDQWHTITINYSDILNRPNATKDFKHLVIKVIDLRGHLYINNLSFVEAPATVTLKNATADGADLTETVAKGSMPTTTPTMEGKTFAGWYDEEGNKVEAISGTTTLVARWKAEVEGSIGDSIYTFNVDDDSLYGTPDGVEKKLSPRGSNNIQNDLEANYYSYTRGYQDGSFVGMQNPNDFNGTIGVTLPAYDFSKSEPLTFNAGFNTGHDGNEAGMNSPLVIDGHEVGHDCDTSVAYTVKIKGQSVSVFNKRLNKTYTFDLSEDVYYGRKGLSLTSKNAPYRFFICTPFKSLLTDYVGEAKAIEANLPDTPTKGDNNLEMVKKYQSMRAVFNSYENSAFPISEKMNAWIKAATPATVLKFEDHGVNLTVDGTAASLINKNAYSGAHEGGMAIEDSIVYRTQGDVSPTDLRACVTLPTFNFSNYGTITFTMGFGGMGVGNRKGARVYLGGSEDKNLAGTSLAPHDNNGYDDIEEFKVTIKGNQASCYNGNETKTITLSDDVIDGTAGLKIGWGGVCEWSWFVISPFSGTII